MVIQKIATERENYQRKFFFENRARDGWKNIISQYTKQQSVPVVLLPAYIGWSPNEGSGIFDPILELKVKFDFYRITDKLQIDMEDFKCRIKHFNNVLVLIVHYFGFPDKNYHEITKWLDENKVCFVEDCAHALLSDEIGGICGRKGEYAFYSLHKLLPFSKGGMVKINKIVNPVESTFKSIENIPYWGYDLHSIYNKRRENFKTLIPLLDSVPGMKLLYDKLPDGIGPQTFPVLLERDRDKIYHEMNAAGFGLVSLYHTMIKEIDQVRFDTSYTISKHIINFPVHQDCSAKQLNMMVDKFKEIYLND